MRISNWYRIWPPENWFSSGSGKAQVQLVGGSRTPSDELYSGKEKAPPERCLAYLLRFPDLSFGTRRV
jgi:hypothetical protein